MTRPLAYGTGAAGGIYRAPVAITRIDTYTGGTLPVQPASCHRAMSAAVAAAATYILAGGVTPGAAPGDGGIRGGGFVPPAGQTGAGNKFDFSPVGGVHPPP